MNKTRMIMNKTSMKAINIRDFKQDPKFRQAVGLYKHNLNLIKGKHVGGKLVETQADYFKVLVSFAYDKGFFKDLKTTDIKDMSWVKELGW